MDVRRETELSHMNTKVRTLLEWDASCPYAVNVTVGQEGVVFHYGIDREVLAKCLNGDGVDQKESSFAMTTFGPRVKITIKVTPPGETAVRTASLWGLVEPWQEFLQVTEKEVPLGSETSFHEGDTTYLEGLGIRLPA